MRIVLDNRYSFKVAGDDRAGWSIVAVPDRGEPFPLIGVYVSRQHAADEMPRIANRWEIYRAQMRPAPPPGNSRSQP